MVPVNGMSNNLNNAYSESQIVYASDAAALGTFGGDIGLTPDSKYAVVGALLANSLAGSAYIFRRDGSNWTEVQQLTESGLASGDAYGGSVAISADSNYIVIGHLAM